MISIVALSAATTASESQDRDVSPRRINSGTRAAALTLRTCAEGNVNLSECRPAEPPPRSNASWRSAMRGVTSRVQSRALPPVSND